MHRVDRKDAERTGRKMRLRSAARVEAREWQGEWNVKDLDCIHEGKKAHESQELNECRTPNKSNNQPSRSNREKGEQEARTPVPKNIKVSERSRAKRIAEEKVESRRIHQRKHRRESKRTETDSVAPSIHDADPNISRGRRTPACTYAERNIHGIAQKFKEVEEGEPSTPVQDTMQNVPPTPVAPKKAPPRTKKRPHDFLMSARRLVFTESNLKKFNDIPSNFPKVKSARH